MTPMQPLDRRSFEPLRIRRNGQVSVEIKWGDGHTSIYLSNYLRGLCPCVACTQERESGVNLPVVTDATVFPLGFRLVGRYALSIIWSDGHADGIFRFSTLRRLCACASCLSKVGLC